MAILEDQFISFGVCMSHDRPMQRQYETIIVLDMSNLTDKAINY